MAANNHFVRGLHGTKALRMRNPVFSLADILFLAWLASSFRIRYIVSEVPRAGHGMCMVGLSVSRNTWFCEDNVCSDAVGVVQD